MAPRGASKAKTVSSKKTAAKPARGAKKPAKPVAPRTRSAKTTSELKPKGRGAAASAKGTAKKGAGKKTTQRGKSTSSSVLGAAVQKALPYVPSWTGLGRWVGRTVG